MLTPQEENLLKDLARKNAPLQVVNPGPTSDSQMSTGQYVASLIRKWTSPLPIIAGANSDTIDNRLRRSYVGEDDELLARTSHVRRRKETMLQFYARVGLGAAQILTMTKSEITHFVSVAEQNEPWEPKLFEPKPLPQRFMIATM